jgi:hypothetical protein
MVCVEETYAINVESTAAPVLKLREVTDGQFGLDCMNEGSVKGVATASTVYE